VEQQNVVAGL